MALTNKGLEQFAAMASSPEFQNNPDFSLKLENKAPVLKPPKP